MIIIIAIMFCLNLPSEFESISVITKESNPALPLNPSTKASCSGVEKEGREEEEEDKGEEKDEETTVEGRGEGA